VEQRRGVDRVQLNRTWRSSLAAFEVVEHPEPGGALRLELLGELDVATVPRLAKRLRELHDAGAPVRIDLSRLTYMDLTVLSVLLRALHDAREEGWGLEVAPEVSAAVALVLDVTDVRWLVWPRQRPAADGDGRLRDRPTPDGRWMDQTSQPSDASPL
jgi:anti-anti-sigma factor